MPVLGRVECLLLRDFVNAVTIYRGDALRADHLAAAAEDETGMAVDWQQRIGHCLRTQIFR